MAIHLSNIIPDSLQNFYQNWYRPEMMALVIVGDMHNIDKMEDDIWNHFNKIPSLKESQFHKNISLNYQNRKPTFLKKEFSINATNENRINNTSIRFYKRQNIKEAGNYTQNLEDDLVRKLLIYLLAKRYKAKQEVYGITYEIFPKFLEPPLAFILNVTVNGNMNKEVIQNAFRAIKEVEYFGFSVHEFNESKQDLLGHIRNIDTTTTSYWADEIIKHYVHKEPIVPNKKVRWKTF